MCESFPTPCLADKDYTFTQLSRNPMKYRWLLIIACVFLMACNGAKQDDPKKNDKSKEPDKSAQNGDSNNEKQDDDQDKKQDDESGENEKGNGEPSDNDSSRNDADGDTNPAEALAAKFKKEQDDFFAAYREASAEEKKEMMEQAPTPEPYLADMQKLAEENPGTEIAASAYVWIATMFRGKEDLVEETYTKLFDDYADSPKMRDICMRLARSKPSAQVEQRLDTLIENSPHDEVKAYATFAKANFANSVMSSIDRVDDPRMAGYYGEESIEYIKNAAFENSAIEGLYETIVDKYPDVEIYGGRKLGQLASSALFELRNLSIGCTAPDIVGNDLDGKEFKLSDYRGKVVLLDFWGDW